MALNLGIPPSHHLIPSIIVIGVGGAGGNAVSNMIASGLKVRCIVADTDSQSLNLSLAEDKIPLGGEKTKGLGAGSVAEVGKQAAEESLGEILKFIEGCDMLFITAGMGGGTGTGAAPVIAKIAKENKILTVAVVTKPFHFEGIHRMQVAEFGLEELQKYVDTLIVIPNQNLFKIATEKTTFAEAFKNADYVLYSGVKDMTDLMLIPGLINLDFADIRSIMSNMGRAMMGTGEASGEGRAIKAAELAISNPLLDNLSIMEAKGILINITGGADMTLFEVDAAANCIREQANARANIIFGSTFDDNMEGKIRVSVVAAGIGFGSSLKADVDKGNKAKLLKNSLYNLANNRDNGDEENELESATANERDIISIPAFLRRGPKRKK